MTVVVLGCGYVGLELSRQLTGEGHDVVGVRRSDEGLTAVEATGASAVQADVTDPDALTAVPDADALVFAASSGGRGAEAARRVYVEGLETVIEQFGARENPPDRLVYTSSTGVYGDHGGDWVDESTPLDPQTGSPSRRPPSTASTAPSHASRASTARTGTDWIGILRDPSPRGT